MRETELVRLQRTCGQAYRIKLALDRYTRRHPDDEQAQLMFESAADFHTNIWWSVHECRNRTENKIWHLREGRAALVRERKKLVSTAKWLKNADVIAEEGSALVRATLREIKNRLEGKT